MGNNQSFKQNEQIKNLKRNVINSPLSPLKKRSKVKNVQKFDWLSQYNKTPSNPNPQALPNKHTFNEFQLHHERCLGEGAFAKVILATHLATGKRAAVKVITKSAIPEDMREYVSGEPGILAQLHHKNIVSLLLVHEDKQFIYMFLQYMEGGDLHSRLERDGAVNEDVARAWFKQMVNALEFSHKNNFCHRDLKLENMLISGEGEKAKVLLIDFGFSAHMPDMSHKFHDFPGSFCYAAPELIQGIPYHGRNADVYSLGVILYTLLQGTYPFYDEDRRRMTKMILREDVLFESYNTTPVKQLVRSMLSKNPEDRPTLQQIKNHPWVRNDSVSMKVKSPIMSRIRNTAKASFSPLVAY